MKQKWSRITSRTPIPSNIKGNLTPLIKFLLIALIPGTQPQCKKEKTN
jgi:hypothetical protein